MEKSLKSRISAWAKGRRERAGWCLVTAGVHIDTAIRLLNGTYSSDPKEKLREQIESALKMK